MENKLFAAVGDTKCKDPKPGNKPKDIATVELWVLAQGANYKMQGKMNPGLVKWIRIYQGSKGKLSKDKINGVMEPGDKTWNAGAVKYFRYRDAIANYEAYEVVENGKTRRIEVDEFIRLQIEVRNKIIRNANAVISECDVIEKLIRSIEETLALQNGFVNGLVAMGMSGFGMAGPPSAKAALNARAAAQAVVSATDRSKVDWKKVKVLVMKANKLHKAAVKEWKAYNDSNMKRAEWGAFGATVVSEGSFAVLEVLATGYLVTTRGMSPKKAQIIAASGVEGIKVSAGELGEYAANDKFDPAKSATKVLGNMFIAGVGAALGAKLSPGAFTKMTKQVSKMASRQFSTRLQKYSYTVVLKILESPVGQNIIKSAIAEAGNLAKDANSGKKIDEKRLMDAVAGVVLGGLAGSAPFKSLKKFDDGWQKRSRDLAVEKLGPKMQHAFTFKMITKHRYRFDTDEITKLAVAECKDVTANVAKKMTEQMGKIAYGHVVNKFTGTETSSETLNTMAMKGVQKDSGFMSAFEAQVIAEGEKRIEKKLAKLEKQ